MCCNETTCADLLFWDEHLYNDTPPRLRSSQIHGFLSAIGWGILLPVGAIFSRYVRPFAKPLWFYIHIFLQLSGYLLGATGFAIGLMLWNFAPPGADFTVHGTLGCAIFALATAQVAFLPYRRWRGVRRDTVDALSLDRSLTSGVAESRLKHQVAC